MLPDLRDCDLEVLRHRYEELDTYTQAAETGHDSLEEIVTRVYVLGGTEEDGWNNYHLVPNEFDRRAAEEFYLGQ